MIGYKGFSKELKCKDYQYEIGKTFVIESDKKLTICPHNTDEEAGLHFCLNPLNVLTYYKNVDGNRYAIVESIGDVLTHTDDSKIATNKLKVIKEITYDELLQLGFEYSNENSINFEIDDNVFEKCPETLKEKHISMYIENSRHITDKMFECCSDELKEKYISMCIEKYLSISDKQFELCSDSLKEKYILMCIKNHDDISEKQFELCSDSLKEKYILMCIKNHDDISEKQFEWCSETLKEKYILSRIEKNWYISDKMFEWCSETLKEKHILSRIEKNRSISGKQFDWCSEILKKIIIYQTQCLNGVPKH